MNQGRNKGISTKRVASWSLLSLLLLLTILIAAVPGFAKDDGLPPWINNATLLASDGAQDDQLGWSAAVSGNTVVVGMYHGIGTAYVYERPAAGWAGPTTQSYRLYGLFDDGTRGINSFAKSVAINGDTIVVGAPELNDNRGAVYVYVKPDSGWVDGSNETVVLTASDRQQDELFGEAVSVSGDVIVVGASGANGDNGVVYLYVKPPGGWGSLAGETMTETTRLILSERKTTDDYGSSVAVSGNMVVVGAPGTSVDNPSEDDFIEDDDLLDLAGRAYIFVEPSEGWPTGDKTEDKTINASDPAAQNHFGSAVDIHVNTIAVGAMGKNNNGKVYVFAKGTTWPTNETAQLTASNGGSGDEFGVSVSISNDTIVVGAHNHANTTAAATGTDVDDAASNHGAAYVYVKSADGWASGATETILTPSDLDDDDFFGSDVSVSGGLIVAGAPGKDITGTVRNDDQGKAYIYQGTFCSQANGGYPADWSEVGTWVGNVIPDVDDDVCISTGDSVYLSETSASRRLLVNPGAVLDLRNFQISAEDSVINNGKMIQTLAVNLEEPGSGKDGVDASAVEFFFIQNATEGRLSLDSGTATKYKGAKITPVDKDLGDVKVILRETIDWLSPTSSYKYCTDTGNESPDYVGRCFNISPIEDKDLNSGVVYQTRVGLYAHKDEFNGILDTQLVVYHSTESGKWEQLSDTKTTCCILDFILVEGTTTGFSSFLLGEIDEVPTVVNFQSIAANSVMPAYFMIISAIMLIVTILVLLGKNGFLQNLNKSK